jgi:CDP-paratose 2-epimerase
VRAVITGSGGLIGSECAWLLSEQGWEVIGIDNDMRRQFFGPQGLAADVLCQEFGHYFQMPAGIFRGGCLTGPRHSAVQLHGYLAYIVICAVTGREYTIIGYKGKQVRDQIHCGDVARLFLEFYRSPRAGEVYNLGGGRATSLSILETIDLLARMGFDCATDIRMRAWSVIFGRPRPCRLAGM